MERDLSQNSALCRSGCGFYGSPATDGLCSKCYKDALKRKQAAPSTTSGASSSSNYSNTSSDSSSLPLLPPTCDRNLNTVKPLVLTAQFNSNDAGVVNKVGSTTTTTTTTTTDKESDSHCADNSNANIDKEEVAHPKIQEPSEDNQNLPKCSKKKKTRCTKCKISVGVIGFPCRCGGVFCPVHRYTTEHSCSFDYKEHGAEEIRKNNPQVVGEKIQKI